ncbi:MAG: helix-turn-helix domain-containing protein [Candidatus Dormibacteraceae bacterium]
MEDESLGGRIRQRRQELGLSLAQVTGEDFSRAFLHQVEHGQSSPSVGVLRLIAKRLDSSLDELVEGEDPFLRRRLLLEKARLDLALGHPEQAEPLLRRLESTAPGRLGSDARLALSRVLLALGKSEEALGLLDREEPRLRERGDKVRLAQLTAIRQGKRVELDASTYQRLAAECLKGGDPSGSLENLQRARIMIESQLGVEAPTPQATARRLAKIIEAGGR